MKIAAKTAEKRLKRFASPIKHDEAQYQHAFDHRRPWYHQPSAICAPTGLPVTGCYGPENAAFFETVAPGWRATSAESLQIRYRRVAWGTAYF
jgi:hypothetical protein